MIALTQIQFSLVDVKHFMPRRVSAGAIPLKFVLEMIRFIKKCLLWGIFW